MTIPNLGKAVKNLQRLSHILNVFIRHGFGHFVERVHLGRYSTERRGWLRFGRYREPEVVRRLTPAERMRMAFEELGGTFIKLGQMLSIRSDILPPDFIAELKKLQTQVSPFPFRQVREIVEGELGRPFEEIFDSFEEKPFAAASIAQVHRARLKGGDEVVVKVQRPEIDRLIETDLDILLAIARLLERYVSEARIYDPVGIAEEFARSIRMELDFTAEASNTDLFRTYFADDPRIKIPKVYWELTTRRVLTLEEIRGIRIDDIGALEAAGIDRGRLAADLLDLFFKQIFVNGLFHADPHPGNIMVLEGGVIGLVDFGTVGRIPGELLRDITEWLIAILNKDVDMIAKIYLKLGIISEDADIARFRIEMADFLDRYLSRPIDRIHLGEMINEITASAPRYRMRMPTVLMQLGKTVVTVESIVTALDPSISVMEIGRPYIRRLILGRIKPREWLKEAYGTLADLSEMARAMPFQLSQIITKLNKGKLKIDFESLGLENLIYEIDRSSNRITFGMIIAALIIGSSIMVWSNVGFKIFGYSAIGIIGYVLAGILGVGLVISILRSGRF